MKKKFKKNLLFYFILLIITFCISHFVSADTDSNLLIPPFFNIKANGVNVLNSAQYTENANETTFYINLNTPVSYANIWPNHSILQNTFKKYLIINVCSLWSIPEAFYYNKNGWLSGQVYMNNGTCYHDNVKGTLSTIILSFDYDKLDIYEESSTTTQYKISMYNNRNNFTFRLFYPNTRTIIVNSIYSSDSLPQQVVDNSAIVDKQKETNTKIDKVNESINSEHDDFSNKSCGLICKLKKLPEQLFNKIKSLFVPDNFDFLNDFKETLENKLGFIASVPLQLLDYLISLKDKVFSPVSTIKFPKISIFGYYFWDEYTINTNDGLSWISSFKYLTDIACVILCCNTLRKWYSNFTGGEEK